MNGWEFVPFAMVTGSNKKLDLKKILESVIAAAVIGLIMGYMLIGKMQTSIINIDKNLVRIENANTKAHSEITRRLDRHIEGPHTQEQLSFRGDPSMDTQLQ